MPDRTGATTRVEESENTVCTSPRMSLLSKRILIFILLAVSLPSFLPRSIQAACRVKFGSIPEIKLRRSSFEPTTLPRASYPSLAASGDTRDRPWQTSGTLIISGGGETPPAVISEFLSAAGGENARLVVIPTANELAGTPEIEEDLDFWRHQNVAECAVLHATSSDVANDNEFCRPLETATGVWFMGGSQSLLAESYLDTRALHMIQEVLNRDGVVGGDSAGAAIMSGVTIYGGYESPRTGRGFAFLPGAVVDQHFVVRNRDSRMQKVLQSYHGLIGLGIDEQTAIIVRNGAIRVTGYSKLVLYQSSAIGVVTKIGSFGHGCQFEFSDLASSHAPEAIVGGEQPTLVSDYKR